ncbi:hypothetical protein, partial [Nostoc sp.]
HVFTGVSRIFIDTLKDIVNLQARTEELQRKIKVMYLERGIAINNSLEDWKDAELAIIKDEMANEIKSDINIFQETLNIKIQEMLATFYDEWASEVSKMKAKRRKRLLVFSLVSGLVGLLVYILYIFGAQKDLSNNIFVATLFGVIVNIASNILGFAWAKFTDKFPISIKAKESNILGRLRGEYLQTIDNEIRKLEDSINPNSQILYNFWKKLLLTEPLKVWSTNQKAFHGNLKAYAKEYSELCREYSQIIDVATEKTCSYFDDPDSNLQKLLDFSENLQQTAIKPSFDLLAETKVNLDTVIQNIKGIDFT